MEVTEIKLKTLTPIWTGGVETGKMDRLHETGIIGSLRWWYEAIVRGLGGDVCDPTSDNPEHRCQFDAKVYEKTKNVEDGLSGVCPVCRLFGCTGWKRRFDLQVTGAQLEPFWLATKDNPKESNHWWLSKVYKASKSYLAVGTLSLRFCWIRGYENLHSVMRPLLSLVSQFAALGPKPQYGFGIVQYDASMPTKEALATIKQHITDVTPAKNLLDGLPDLRNFWLLQCDVPQQDVNNQFGSVNVVGSNQAFNKYKSQILPVSFDIRYKLPNSSDKAGLRQAYRLKHGKMPTRRVFGTLEGKEKDKRASSVFVSHLYKSEKDDFQLRVWGFTDIPLVDEIEPSLKKIFPNLNVSRKLLGTDLLADKGAHR